MAGVNLREGIMEVAFEQWTERKSADAGSTSRLQRFPALQGSDIGRIFPYRQRAESFSLNLGGNTDVSFALSIAMLRAFSFAAELNCRTGEDSNDSCAQPQSDRRKCPGQRRYEIETDYRQ